MDFDFTPDPELAERIRAGLAEHVKRENERRPAPPREEKTP